MMDEDLYQQGTMNPAKHRAAHPSLRERVAAQILRAQSEAQRFNQLSELQYLLEQNPETARILELLEETRDPE